MTTNAIAIDEPEFLEPDVILGPVHTDDPMSDRDLAYTTERWDRFMYREAVDRIGELKNAHGRYADTEWPAFVREVFARLLGAPLKLDEPALGGEWATALHETIDGAREWAELVLECRGDDDLAAYAAASVTAALELPEKPPKDPKDAAQEAAELCERAQLEAEAGEEEKAAKTLANAGRAHVKCVRLLEAGQALAAKLRTPATAGAMRRAVRVAIGKATENAKATKNAMTMLACGNEPSSPQRIAWRHRIATNKDLLKICDLAGRMEAAVSAHRAQVRSDFGREDLVGVRYGDSLPDAVPMERAMFVIDELPELGLLQMGKLAEGRLLQNHQVGLVDEKKANKGPLVFAVDESSSMLSGSPFAANIVAKAVMLTLMRRCAEERRTFGIVHWSTDAVSRAFPQGVAMNEVVVDELTKFLGGGTAIANAIKHSTRIIKGEQPEMPKEDAERADVVLLTDACSYEHGEINAACDELGKTGARLFTIHVDTGTDHETLRKRSMRYVKLTGAELGDGTTVAIEIHSGLDDKMGGDGE